MAELIPKKVEDIIDNDFLDYKHFENDIIIIVNREFNYLISDQSKKCKSTSELYSELLEVFKFNLKQPLESINKETLKIMRNTLEKDLRRLESKSERIKPKSEYNLFSIKQHFDSDLKSLLKQLADTMYKRSRTMERAYWDKWEELAKE